MSGNVAPEFELLLACCRAASESELFHLLIPPLDCQTLLDSAEHHRLIPALHNAWASAGKAVPSTLRDRARTHTWRAIQFTAELARIARHFDQRGIEFLAYKGPALAQLLYGEVTMRQFGDLDLLVRRRDVSRACTALLELGFKPQLSLSPRQDEFHLRTGNEYAFGIGPEPHLLELQWQIVPRFYSIELDMDALFARSTRIELGGTAVQAPGREDLMLLLCIHAAKHEWSELGMFRDIATLAQRDLDWNWIWHEARRRGIARIVQISLLAAHELIGIELPKAGTLPAYDSAAAPFVSTILGNLRRNREPQTESLRYFRRQAQLRERWRDRLRFAWRLGTTASVAEWEMLRLPDQLSALYRAVRIVRLLKRFVAAGEKQR